MTAFDWGALLRAGVRDARLRPVEFWQLSPAELLMVLGKEGGASPSMARARLDELAAQWPDAPLTQTKEMDDG